ncbi:DMT family transporter [Noviherbaspirillum sp. CPCC 100848]|uniref:DMT family transporter n=1 Tax=Noviherbaspirillum album TaxID=3080276 RepID=A0ABU6JG77_9BURK|nr:DMT family transporter [Noviherbaspirillum sp. CPCC 100848]MEC4722290.1 DMT family transporter [Noviherbaspirillum sp. CPCC 100848]
MKQTNPASAITMITLAALLFSLMDAGTKYLGALLPMVLILWCRYAIQTLVMAGTVLINRGLAGFRTGHLRVQFLRGTMLIMLSVLTFYSLQYLPLAEFTAIIMLSPIFVTVLTSRLSQRPLGPLRWLLILTAFAGTMTVIRPGSALFNIVALLPLVATVVSAAYNLVTSRLALLDNPHTTQFYTGLTGVALLSPLIALQAGQLQELGIRLETSSLLLLLAVGLLGTVAHLLLVMAFRRMHPAALMPFTYTQIAFAALIGWIFFRHSPDFWAWLGMGVIAASSCMSAWLDMHESRRLSKK